MLTETVRGSLYPKNGGYHRALAVVIVGHGRVDISQQSIFLRGVRKLIRHDDSRRSLKGKIGRQEIWD